MGLQRVGRDWATFTFTAVNFSMFLVLELHFILFDRFPVLCWNSPSCHIFSWTNSVLLKPLSSTSSTCVPCGSVTFSDFLFCCAVIWSYLAACLVNFQVFIFRLPAVLGLCCCTGFSLVVQASHCSGFSCCGAQVLGCSGFSGCSFWL